MSFDCVIDANVCIKLFLNEPLSDQATKLFAQLADDLPPRFYAPDLLYIECANILWKYVAHYGYRPESASQDLSDILELPIVAISTANLTKQALELGIRFQIAAYDAAYVVLSYQLALPLVTADERLVRQLRHTHFDVCPLANWPQLPIRTR